MPDERLVGDVKSQVAEIREKVFQVCRLNEATGRIEAKPGITKNQILQVISSIKKIESIYNERIADLDVLNAELDEHEKNVQKTSQKMSNLIKIHGEDIFPKWLRKSFGLK